MKRLRISPSGPLRGRIRVPGDKSISHRALMLSAIAKGETRIRGLLRSEDVEATLKAFTAMGLEVGEEDSGDLVVRGRGADGLNSPEAALDLGNSGTSMRLLAGMLAGLNLDVVLTGDQSLNKRPMGRVIEPLALMGADIKSGPRGTAPLAIKGKELSGIRYRLPMASAQVKSAILLAGLFAKGETRVAEPAPTRDHTELMLPAFGIRVIKDGEWIGVGGGGELVAAGEIEVPGDFSSAAFFIVAASIVPGSDIVIENVGINPTRTGLLDVLELMQAKISIQNERSQGQEPVADLRVRSAALVGVEVSGDLVPRAIDEMPALCVAAAKAHGRTVIRDAKELRVKESDRIESMAIMLESLGVDVRELPDGLEIEGPADLIGTSIDCCLDHRVAMAAAVAGLVAKGETTVNKAECIDTSFPEFEACLTAVSS